MPITAQRQRPSEGSDQDILPPGFDTDAVAAFFAQSPSATAAYGPSAGDPDGQDDPCAINPPGLEILTCRRKANTQPKPLPARREPGPDAFYPRTDGYIDLYPTEGESEVVPKSPLAPAPNRAVHANGRLKVDRLNAAATLNAPRPRQTPQDLLEDAVRHDTFVFL